MDKLDFLTDSAPAETPTAAETPAEATVTSTAPEPAAAPDTSSDGRTRGPDGKFVAKAADAESAPQTPAIAPEAALAAQAQPDAGRAPEGYVPIAALQALREEFNTFKRQPAPAPQQQAYQPQPGDEGFEDWQDQQAYEQTVSATASVRIARGYAVKEHGETFVDQAQQWAAQRFNLDPMFRQQSLSADNPLAFAIDEFQHHQALQLLRDPKVRDQFMALANGQTPANPQAAAAAPAPAAPTPPPASITSAPSAGGSQHTPTGEGVAYGSIFK